MQEEHRQYLDLLAIFHYLVGAIAALFGFFPFIHLALGLGLMAGTFPTSSENGIEPLLGVGMGCFFAFFALSMIACCWGYAAGMFAAGRYLKQRRKHLFCLVMAGISCMFMPFGTVLGVITLLLLLQDDVKQAFGVGVSEDRLLP